MPLGKQIRRNRPRSGKDLVVDPADIQRGTTLVVRTPEMITNIQETAEILARRLRDKVDDPDLEIRDLCNIGSALKSLQNVTGEENDNRIRLAEMLMRLRQKAPAPGTDVAGQSTDEEPAVRTGHDHLNS